MDLEARKSKFIKELLSIEKESIMDTLERVLKREKEAYQEVSAEHQEELDDRLESYKNNPSNVLDWNDEKDDW